MRKRTDRTASGIDRVGPREIRAGVKGPASLARFAVVTAVICELAISVQAYAQVGYNMDLVWQSRPPPGCTDWGYTVTSGDFNGDGSSDIAFSYDSAVADSNTVGKVRVYFGGPLGLDTLPGLVFGWAFGQQWLGGVCGLGDINGDRFDDLLLEDFRGKLDVCFGGKAMDTAPDFVLANPEGPESGLGLAVHGDLNGDGYQDIIVQGDSGGYMCRVYVYYGGPTLAPSPSLILRGGAAGSDAFGSDLASGGDLNGDGFDDLVVGDWMAHPGGKLYVYFGGNPMDTTHDALALPLDTAALALDLFGCAGIDILRRDGEPDWLVAGAVGQGVYVYYGSDSLRGAMPGSALRYGPVAQTDFGTETHRAGRVDGGRYDGFMTGATEDCAQWFSTVYVWPGQRSFDTLPNGWMRAAGSGWSFSFVNASAGDVDGDGRDEVIFSNYPAPRAEERGVWVCKYTATGISGPAGLPGAGRGLRVVPNPCVAAAFLTLEGPQRGRAKFTITDLSGKRIRDLEGVRGSPEGRSRATWDLRDNQGTLVPAGVYFVQASFGNGTPRETRKVIVRP